MCTHLLRAITHLCQGTLGTAPSTLRMHDLSWELFLYPRGQAGALLRSVIS
jgi:hypothetical protein